MCPFPNLYTYVFQKKYTILRLPIIFQPQKVEITNTGCNFKTPVDKAALSILLYQDFVACQ